MKPGALFMDCYGTLVAGDRPVIDLVVRTTAVCAGVDAQRLDRAWWERFRMLCAQRSGAAFGSQRDLEVEAMSDVLRDCGATLPESQVVELLQPLFHYWRTAEPFADAIALLESWTACPVLIVSNIDRDDLDAVRHALPAVAHLVTSEDARSYKPDPTLFQHALATTGLTPERVVHVGDSWDSDILGARAAGITAVWLDRNRAGSSIDTAQPRPRITSLSQLAGCIEALPAIGPPAGSRS